MSITGWGTVKKTTTTKKAGAEYDGVPLASRFLDRGDISEGWPRCRSGKDQAAGGRVFSSPKNRRKATDGMKVNFCIAQLLRAARMSTATRMRLRWFFCVLF